MSRGPHGRHGPFSTAPSLLIDEPARGSPGGTGPGPQASRGACRMLMAPADSPKTVTLPGFHHQGVDVLTAPIRERRPGRAGRCWRCVRQVEEALGARPPVQDEQTTPSRAKCPPSSAAVPLSLDMPPWIHTLTVARPRRGGRPDVEVQAVLGGCCPVDARDGRSWSSRRNTRMVTAGPRPTHWRAAPAGYRRSTRVAEALICRTRGGHGSRGSSGRRPRWRPGTLPRPRGVPAQAR